MKQIPYQESGEGHCLTPCPYNVKCGPKKETTVNVNSVVCRFCASFVKSDPETKTITCKYKESLPLKPWQGLIIRHTLQENAIPMVMYTRLQGNKTIVDLETMKHKESE